MYEDSAIPRGHKNTKSNASTLGSHHSKTSRNLKLQRLKSVESYRMASAAERFLFSFPS
jgi:hypothetical protein